MITYQRIINYAVLPVIYIVSFLCLVSTSMFQKLTVILGSFWTGVIAVNAPVLLILVIVLMCKGQVYKYIFTICAVFQVFSIMCYSRLNWFDILFKIKLTSKIPVALTAVVVFITFLAYIMVDNIIKYRENCEHWLLQGAHRVEIKAAKGLHLKSLSVVGTVFFALIVLIVLFGFVVLKSDPEQVEPTIMALLGIVVVWGLTWITIFRLYGKKSD